VILSYSNWKILTESSDSTVRLYVQAKLSDKIANSRINRAESDQILTGVKLKILSIFPNATSDDAASVIIIPQEKFEDLEGKTEPLKIKLPTFFSISPEIAYPKIISDWFIKNCKEDFSKGDTRIVNCLLNDEFLNYSKDQLIDKINADLFKTNGISDEEIQDEIEHIMLSQSLGEIGGSVESLTKKLIDTLGNMSSIENSIKLLEELNIEFDRFDVSTIDSQIENRFSRILVDYSKLSKKQLNVVLEEIANALQFLNKLFDLGKEISKIALKRSDELLDHLDNYPKVLEMLYSTYL
jgi:hypothetical protein